LLFSLVYERLFDYHEAMDSVTVDTEQTVSLLRDAALALRSVTAGPTEVVRTVHAAINALQAVEADQLAVIDASKAHAAEGCASVATWGRRELGQDPGTTRQMVRAARTMREMPSIAAAAHAGRISLDHVHACTYGLKHVGHDETIALQPQILDVATKNTPRDLFNLMRYAKAIIHSDELDEAWLNGMEKEDFRCVRVGDGYQPTGFFGIDLGAKVNAYLAAASVPPDGDDNRSAAQRRTDAFNDLITNALGNKLKNTNTVGAHVNVIADAETLKAALTGSTETAQGELLDREPAILEGFGPIGPALLAFIAFGGNLTPILVAGFKENRKVLDVGRTQRLATTRQRRAIHIRQHGRCANRGCHHPIGEIHHVIAWLYGGKTNLSNLAGLCRKCHALISMGRLQMTGTFDTGYTFTTARAGPLARTG
jgi:hypothetical protein